MPEVIVYAHRNTKHLACRRCGLVHEFLTRNSRFAPSLHEIPILYDEQGKAVRVCVLGDDEIVRRGVQASIQAMDEHVLLLPIDMTTDQE